MQYWATCHRSLVFIWHSFRFLFISSSALQGTILWVSKYIQMIQSNVKDDCKYLLYNAQALKLHFFFHDITAFADDNVHFVYQFFIFSNFLIYKISYVIHVKTRQNNCSKRKKRKKIL